MGLVTSIAVYMQSLVDTHRVWDYLNALRLPYQKKKKNAHKGVCKNSVMVSSSSAGEI